MNVKHDGTYELDLSGEGKVEAMAKVRCEEGWTVILERNERFKDKVR